MRGLSSLLTQLHLQLLQSIQSLLLWLLLRGGVWPFCTWPFLHFSIRSRLSPPSSSVSVSSLSLRSSSTMSCQVKCQTRKAKQPSNVHSCWFRGESVVGRMEGKLKAAVHTLPGRNLMTMRKMSPAQKMCRACSRNISPLKK